MTDTSKREDVRIINPHEGAASLAVHAADGRVLLAIHQDGTVTGAVEDASEAGARFVSYLRAHVFEQAHTPTDDEREATAKAIRLSLRFDLGWSADEARTLGAVLAEPVATRLAALRRTAVPTDGEREAATQELCGRCGWAISGHLRSQYGLDCPPGGARPGFRRTAVQEPSAEEVDESAPRYQPCHFDTSGMYVRTWCHTHGCDHLTPDGDVYVQGFDLGDGKTYTGPVSQEDLFGVEPQGEPTDAHITLRAFLGKAATGADEEGKPVWAQLMRDAANAPAKGVER